MSNIFPHSLKVHIPTLLPGYKTFIEHEYQAKTIRYFNSSMIPGLLQTEDYIRAVVKAIDSSIADFATKEEWIEVKLQRQWVAMERKNPPHIEAIIEEGGLLRQFGGPAVLREQLQHLLRLVQVSSVNIYVLPFTAGQHLPCFTPSFTLIQSHNKVVPDFSSIEDMFGQNNTEDLLTCRVYNTTFHRLKEMSYDQPQSIACIEKIIANTGL